jgi:hypothetical protein
MPVDGHGSAVSSTDPGDGATAVWTVTGVDDDSRVTAVSCPAATLCAAGDQPGNALAGLGQMLTVTLAGKGSGSVTSDDDSISCSATCSSERSAGTTVTLIATPVSDAVFTGGSGGGCSGTGLCSVLIGSDQAVTATFTANVAPPAPISVPARQAGLQAYAGESAAGGSSARDEDQERVAQDDRAKRGKRSRRTRTFHLAAVTVRARAGVPLTLTVKPPPPRSSPASATRSRSPDRDQRQPVEHDHRADRPADPGVPQV